MKKTVILILFTALLTVMQPSCKAQIDSAELIIASWNMQNMFDAVDDGTEPSYTQFTSQGKWTEENYKKRLEKAVTVLSTGMLKKANIIVLNEVENENVIKDLLSYRELRTRGFKYFAFAKNSSSSIGTAVISSIEFTGAQIHSSSYRPVLQVDFDYEMSPVSLLAIHAKSRLEGVSETASLRLETANVIKDISDDILENNPNVLVVAAGDFNDTYEDCNMMSSVSGSSPLIVTSDKTRNNYWYCFWMDEEKSIWPEGSYYWSEDASWESFDNILVRNVSSALEISNSGVLFEGIIKTVDGKPNSFVRNLLTGVSDHLPVWLSLH